MLKAFIEEAMSSKSNSFVSYEWSSRVVQRGKQTFAIFGGLAYDVSKQKFDYDDTCLKGTGKICVPIKGRYLAAFPDEGTSGILGMYIVNYKGKHRKSGPAWVPCGWLYTKELDLTNEQITQNIIEDIEDGKNVLTSPPPGWV